jgi:hypothetical protein
LYNDIRPGMQDQTPGDRAHSELHLILPDDVRYDGIDAERAKEGVQVCFAYPYCRAHDVIRLNCNGKDVMRIVAPGEAPATPSAERTTICVMVGEEVFQQAGDSPNFVFSYTVTDQLGNGPDADSPYSGTVEIDVHLKEPRLVAPIWPKIRTIRAMTQAPSIWPNLAVKISPSWCTPSRRHGSPTTKSA